MKRFFAGTLAALLIAICAFSWPSHRAAVGQTIFEQLVTPGELSEAHAKLEKTCNSCHASFAKDEQPALCLTCHKVSLDVPVNDYRWLRGQNEYDNWHDSGVAQNAARTFYRPRDPITGQPVKKNCQDCHMPLEDAPLGDVSAKDGKVRSHRFIAVNTALPALPMHWYDFMSTPATSVCWMLRSQGLHMRITCWMA